ncbi:hypothetical protein HBI25_194000 [Parastagonospora nodorum]|nr:hypothetical protein HBH82_185050 [Parastagonospora nodorum]KAH4663755.1 hypothetical protein HBH78_211390 [Parastagonospora nodorum]KAH4698370.1 hypothetical protein HBH67_176010 [Parastagonospora nodorum]KAH4759226.1 hypothetical protein HBH63_221380 [Parastagonospora nodorum]KAH4774165.1 hypothetical protein HBH62_185890 [Parastagonospora nodorum]
MWVCVCDHGGYVDKRGLCMRSDVRSWWDLSTVWRTEIHDWLEDQRVRASRVCTRKEG